MKQIEKQKNRYEEDKEIVNKIRNRSNERLQRIVIDEELSTGIFRVLSAELKPKVKENRIIDPLAWSEETEHHLSKKQLGKLLSKDQLNKIREGQVFRIKNKRTKNIYNPVKKDVKERTKTLLIHEGIILDEAKEGR